jgi:limonene-1,2-epoxide hydrolase
VDSESDAEHVVNQFLATWPRGDIEEMLGFFADDAIYHNIPLEPAVGTEAIRAHITESSDP